MFSWLLRPLHGEGNGTPLQYSCLENPMHGGTWWAAVHGVATRRTRLSDFTFTFHFHALEEKMATHSSILAWRIPGMGEPGKAAVYGVAESQTRLKWLSSSSRPLHINQMLFYHRPDSMLVLEINSIVGFVANYLCLVLGYLAKFLYYKTLTGWPWENLLKKKL